MWSQPLARARVQTIKADRLARASAPRYAFRPANSHNIDVTELRPFDDHPGIAAFGFLKLFHDEPDGCFAAVKFAQLLPRSNFPCGQLKEGAASALDQR